MDIICCGEALIDFFAVQSGKNFNEVEEFKRVAGGAPANVSVGCAKLGKKSAFIGRVGNDYFGLYLKETLQKNNVDVSQMQFDNYARTGLAFISLPTSTTREFLFYRNPSADMNLDFNMLDKNFIKNTKIFHFGSITLINEPAKSSTIKAVKLAKKSGAVISYDPNLRINLWADASLAKKVILNALKYADFLKCNDEELVFLTEINDIKKACQKILKLGPKLCAITLGAKGSLIAGLKFNEFLPIIDVKTIDSTGCGDSFVAGFLSKMVEKLDVKQFDSFSKLICNKDEIIKIAKFATAAASITSTRIGVIPSLPKLEEVVKFMSEKNF